MATEFWPLDVLLLGKGVVGLGATLGKKAVKSLLREGLMRIALAGPTADLASQLTRTERLLARLFYGWKPTKTFLKESGILQQHFTSIQEVGEVVPKGGARLVDDMSNPLVREVRQAINGRLDMPRVMHSAQDQSGSYREAATSFLPDGSVVRLKDGAAVKAFYDLIGRKTREQSWARLPNLGVDELAARRAKLGKPGP